MAARTTITHEGERIYCKPIERAVLRDARLSFGARGLFCFLWDLPSGWEANSRHLATMSPAGRTSILTMLNELKEIGAVKIVPVQGEGGLLAGKVWIIRSPHLWAVEAPLKTEIKKHRRSENPTVGEPQQKVHHQEGCAIKRFTKAPSESDSKAKSDGEKLLAAYAARYNKKKMIA